MSPLSANTLFHFTSSGDKLLSILENEFYPRYSWESMVAQAPNSPNVPMTVAFPLVAFCDIPLSQTVNHMRTYGRYALGLTKEWALRNQVAPVLYAQATSAIPVSMARLIAEVAPDGKAVNHLLRIIWFTKPYEGRSFRAADGGSPTVVRFYDEREWRWVPDDEVLASFNLPTFLKKDDDGTGENAALASNALAERCRLSFEPNDIKYIVVANDDEALDFVAKIEGIKDKYPPKQVRLLTTRLITAEQIERDF